MALNVSKLPSTGGNFKRQAALEAGAYPARLVQLIDLGLQSQRPYKGEDKPPKPEVHFTYEFLDEFVVDEDGNEMEDKPRWLSEDIPMNPLDSDLAKSTKRYIAFDPELEHGGDWAKIIAMPCVVTITNVKDKQGKKVIARQETSVNFT